MSYSLRMLRVALAVAIANLRIKSRYPGLVFIDFLRPIIMALLPQLFGKAMSGQHAQAAFVVNVGIDDPRAFMLIGAIQLGIASGILWGLGFWLRRELATGTLEANYLAPVPRPWLLLGLALYCLMRDTVVFACSFLVGAWLFQIELWDIRVAYALALVAIGTLPLYGIGLLYAAMVLRLKEVGSLTEVLQWTAGLLMGVTFPITVLPSSLRALAYAFPPGWITNGVRALLLGTAWQLGTWYRDLGMVFVYALIFPLLGIWAFIRGEDRLRAQNGVGAF